MTDDDAVRSILMFLLFSFLSQLRKRDYPSVLYHYSNLHGTLGILESSRLWATGAYFLNDPREIEYGLELMEDLIKGLKPSAKNKGFRSFLDNLQKLLGDPNARVQRVQSIFVASFCEVPDILTQWKAYGSEGIGYCLGFETHRLEGLKVKEAPKDFMTDLVKIEYRREKQTEILREALNDIETALKNSPFDLAQWQKEFALLAWEVLFSTVLGFKHYSFESEKEWRLIVRPHPTITREGSPVPVSESPVSFKPCFTTASGYLKPHVELEPDGSAKLPLQSICLGPKLSDDNAEISLKLLCATRGYSLAGVSRSICRIR